MRTVYAELPVAQLIENPSLAITDTLEQIQIESGICLTNEQAEDFLETYFPKYTHSDIPKRVSELVDEYGLTSRNELLVAFKENEVRLIKARMPC